jgi:hypothetical protein
MITIEIINKIVFINDKFFFPKIFSSFWIFSITTEKVEEVGEKSRSFSRFVYKGLGRFVVKSAFWKLVLEILDVDFSRWVCMVWYIYDREHLKDSS